MHRLPQKASLVDETAAFLREQISAGVFPKQLPGEHELSAKLVVSRVTLRAALRRLQREGVVRSRQGSPREIVGPVRPCRRGANKEVILLAPLRLEHLPVQAWFWIDTLREHLYEAGYSLDIHCGGPSYARFNLKAFDNLAQRLDPACWILYRATEPIQRWFAARRLPCVVAGTRHLGLELPSVDIAYRAVSRHAVGQFVSKGHRRLVLLNPDSGSASEFESEQGFNEGVRGTHSGIKASVVWHDGTVDGVCAQMRALLLGPEPAKAILVSGRDHTLTVISYLMSQGLRLPKDCAVISRDDAPFLANMVPSVARYSFPPSTFARTLSRVVLDLVRSGEVPPDEHKLVPHFIVGDTLG
jgi:LacI family transcriptional regulator